jgi:hypothetical protein
MASTLSVCSCWEREEFATTAEPNLTLLGLSDIRSVLFGFFTFAFPYPFGFPFLGFLVGGASSSLVSLVMSIQMGACGLGALPPNDERDWPLPLVVDFVLDLVAVFRLGFCGGACSSSDSSSDSSLSSSLAFASASWFFL